MTQVTIEQLMATALRYHHTGRLPQAEQIYQQILSQAPGHVPALHHLGLIAYQVGRNDVAVQLFRRAIALRPNDAESHFNLGNALTEKAQLDESIAAYRQAIALKPSYAEAYNNLGIALAEKDQLDDAITAWRQAIILKPNYADACSNLGVALQNRGQFDEAIIAHRRAISLRPGYAEAHGNLGFALAGKGQLEEAIAACRQAITLKPTYVEAYNNLGIALAKHGQLDEAIVAWGQAIVLKPAYAEAYNNLGVALRDKGQLDEAIAAYRQAIALRPGYFEALCNHGNALRSNGHLDEAIAAYRQAMAFRSDDPEVYSNLGNALQMKGELDGAVAAYHRAIALKPGDAEVHSNLGNALKIQGRLEEARVAFERAVGLGPENPTYLSNLLLLLQYHPGYSSGMIYREQRRWHERFGQPQVGLIGPHHNTPDPDRRLRIGYVSPDLRTHSMSKFLLPVIENHDPAQVEVFCYAEVAHPDDTTRRFRECAGVWRNSVGLSDEQLAEIIRKDAIDILVDLAMHSADNRLMVFGRKPAPVQVTWLAYPGGTGLDAIDYRITDRFLDPLDSAPGTGLPGIDDTSYAETSIRLPDCWTCYRPALQTPEVNDLPALNTGQVTFGCLNNFCKVSSEVLACWCRLLQAVPGARLRLHAPEGSHRKSFQDILVRHDIDPNRLSFVASLPELEYLRLYHQIDICLDPFPCSGGVTSCDSLWMGVPVVSLKGRTAAGRGTATLLYNAGLPDLVADSEEQYIQIAKALAGDLSRLNQLRSSLRRRLQASPLMDGPRLTRNLESAYREMWQRWCNAAGE